MRNPCGHGQSYCMLDSVLNIFPFFLLLFLLAWWETDARRAVRLEPSIRNRRIPVNHVTQPVPPAQVQYRLIDTPLTLQVWCPFTIAVVLPVEFHKVRPLLFWLYLLPLANIRKVTCLHVSQLYWKYTAIYFPSSWMSTASTDLSTVYQKLLQLSTARSEQNIDTNT